MAKFEIVPGLYFVDRKGWNSDKDLPRKGRKVSRNRRTHVIIHHTVIVDKEDETPNLWERESDIFKNMRKLQIVRRADLGADVPYNFVAYFIKKKSGLMICEGRGEDRTGAHTKGHNTHGIAVSFAGNFENEDVAGIEFARRMYLLSYFLGWLKFNPSHPEYGNYRRMKNLGSVRPEGRRIFFHQDFKNTACPGNLLKPHLNQLDFLKPEFQ